MKHVRCVNCEHAKWRGGKSLPGDCVAPLPVLPQAISVFYAPPTRVEIWSESHGECALYRRRANAPGSTPAPKADLGVWAGLVQATNQFGTAVQSARATTDKHGLPKGFLK